MTKEKIKQKIVEQLLQYEQLLAQRDFERAGDLYGEFMFTTLKQFTKSRVIAEQIIDELLFQKEHPNIQIEMASEAIGLNYHSEQALQLLESLAIWTDDMTPTNKKGQLCSTAQSRLRNLYGYEVDDLTYTWKRPSKLEITPAYAQFFNERHKLMKK